MAVNRASAGQRSVSFFCVYAPQDASLYKQLEDHLSPLIKHERLISMWSIDDILPGADRDVEIERYLNTAQMILLFLSSDFLASNHCYDIMVRALQPQRESHIHVIPIRLRPVDWEMLPVSRLQALPSNGRPVTNWRNRNEAFALIVKGIRKIVGALSNPAEENSTITENYLSYLDWLIKHTSFLDTRGISSTQRLPQVKLEEVYISLQAGDEGSFQRPTPPLQIPIAKTAEQADVPPPPPLSLVVVHHDHLMILGEPGSGKTTSLRYLALKHAQALRNQPNTDIGNARFPILLRIAEYVEYGMRQGKSLSEFLAENCIRHECPTPGLADILSVELQAGRCLILFDGLDEVLHTEERLMVVRRIEEFVSRYESVPNRFIVTSRSAGYSEASLNDTFAHYTLQEIEETDIQRFLESWCLAVERALFPGDAPATREMQAKREIDGLINAVQTVPGVRRLAANPLYLRILAQLHRSGVPLPRRRVALYKQLTETLIRTWRSTQGISMSALTEVSSLFDQPHVTRLLSKLAYWLHMQKPGGFVSEREICRELGKEWARLVNRVWHEDDPNIEKEIRQFLQAVWEHTGLLVKDATHQYGFAHPTFEEYYAAHYLIANGHERAKRIRVHLHDPRWQEPILLALGFIGMESPKEAHVLVEAAILAEGEKAAAENLGPSPYESFLGRDYLFALRCLGDDIPVHSALAEQLIERLLRELTIRTGLGQFRKYEEALAEGLRYLEASIYAPLLLPYVVKNLESTDRGLRLWSLYRIGYIGRSIPEEVRPLLLETLHDEDSQIRSAALWGLSHISGPEITDILLDVLSNDADTYVRQYAIKHLGERREPSPHVTKALLGVLHETAVPDRILLRSAAVESLGQRGDASPEVISALIALLRRDILLFSDESVLKSLRQLSQLSSEVVPMMANAFRDAAPRVRVALAEALETFGHTAPEAIAELRNVPLERSSGRIFQVSYCVKQRYWLPNEVEELLLYKLRDSRSRDRWEVVKALGELEELSDRAETALLEVLHDEDAFMRIRVLETLNAFELSSEMLDIFINVLSNETDAHVRACVVKCLGDIDQSSEDIVQALLQALHDTEDYVRSCAVENLGYIAPTWPEVLAALVFALRNDAFFGVRWEVVKGLLRLEELPEIAIPAIIQALSDEEHWAVRQDCAHLLGQGGSSDEQTIEALLKGLSDIDMLVRKACSQALVQLGQRFPESVETITMGLARIVQEQQDDTVYRFGHDAPCDVAYDALWLLISGGPFESS